MIYRYTPSREKERRIWDAATDVPLISTHSRPTVGGGVDSHRISYANIVHLLSPLQYAGWRQ